MQRIPEYLPAAALTTQGSTLAEVGEKLRRGAERVVAALNGLSEEELNARPGRGWSAAEYADHLHRTSLLFLRVLEHAARVGAPVEFPRGRMDRGGRMEAVRESFPEPGVSLTGLTDNLRGGVEELIRAAAKVERRGALHGVCCVHPYFGPLSALELLQAQSLHLRHHAERHLERRRPASGER